MSIIFSRYIQKVGSYNGQFGARNILITSGIAAEINSKAELALRFKTSQYDRINIEMTEATTGFFRIEISTFESSDLKKKSFVGEIKLIDGEWSVTYDDGIIDML